MERTRIRNLIKSFLVDANVTELTSEVAEDLAEYLQNECPSEAYGNIYRIACKFMDFSFVPNVSGRIDRCDAFEPDFIIASFSFSIDENLRIMVWAKDPFALTLDMNNLSKDDETDIMHIDREGRIDIYKTFMRVAPKDRGKLADRIPNSLALELFGTDIPPYAFYHYSGKFYSATTKAVGGLGGGFGFGGFVRELGNTAEINRTVVSIGEHAFDGCPNLAEVHISGNVHHIGKHAFANTPGLIIRCHLPEKPATWDEEWCDENCRVYFGN